jgi:hypothetical protein
MWIFSKLWLLHLLKNILKFDIHYTMPPGFQFWIFAKTEWHNSTEILFIFLEVLKLAWCKVVIMHLTVTQQTLGLEKAARIYAVKNHRATHTHNILICPVPITSLDFLIYVLGTLPNWVLKADDRLGYLMYLHFNCCTFQFPPLPPHSIHHHPL